MRLSLVFCAVALSGCMAHQMNTAFDEPEEAICRGTTPSVWRCVYERLREDEARPVRTCAEVDAAIAACEKEIGR